jgi:hypothetical protein
LREPRSSGTARVTPHARRAPDPETDITRKAKTLPRGTIGLTWCDDIDDTDDTE